MLGRPMVVVFVVVCVSLVGETARAEEDYLSRTHRVGDEWLIGPQPEADDFQQLRSAGIRTVINSRRPSEMSQLDLDEHSLSVSQGMVYRMVPTGGEDYPFNPDRLARFTAVLEQSEGPVLLHCRSGYRASVLLAGYLVTRRGMSVEEAVETVASERVTGETVRRLLEVPAPPSDAGNGGT